MEKNIKDALVTGKLARLIPVMADSKKEERATSSLLASFMVVQAFAHEVLAELGAPIGKRSVVECFTEVCFKSDEKINVSRPDGLIIVMSGSKSWSALVESKVGIAQLSKDQIEAYLDLARLHGIDAVITLSNQYAITPKHHPVSLHKQKLKYVSAYHYSWLALISKAVLITDNKKISDPEQAYILNELIRYYRHESSGVTQFSRMDGDWRNVCTSILQSAALTKTSPEVVSAVVSWQQLLKYLALDLSMKIGQPVSLYLSKLQTNELETKFQEDCEQLVKTHCLDAQFDIPNAASRLIIQADFVRRTLNFSMKLDAPKDRVRAPASINWLTKQLRGKPNVEGLIIRANWPRRKAFTTGVLEALIEKPESLVPEGVNDIPTSFEIARIVDLMARFKGAQTFVEDASHNMTAFYNDVGQHLSKWVAKAPKIKDDSIESSSVPTTIPGSDETVELVDDGGGLEPVNQAPSFLRRLLQD